MVERRLLLLSNSTQHGTGYLEYCSAYVKSFFRRYDVTKVLFVPYAVKHYADYAKKAKAAFHSMGLEIESIHEKQDAIQAVRDSEGIFIGGGNTFRLLTALYEKQLIEPIRQQVLQNGVPYMGASAGTNVATASICTTNDMPICYPPSFTALSLVPFNINPHYVDPDPNSKHMGVLQVKDSPIAMSLIQFLETREQRIKEYHEFPDVPSVLGLREGCMLTVEDNTCKLQGLTGGILFQSDKDPVCFEPGEDLSFLLEEKN